MQYAHNLCERKVKKMGHCSKMQLIQTLGIVVASPFLSNTKPLYGSHIEARVQRKIV